MSKQSLRVRLLKAHTHAGKHYPAGETLEVPNHIAVWLGERGIAEAAPAAAGKSTKSKQEG